MFHFFNAKNKRIIAGIIAAVLVISMLVTDIVSILA